MSHAYHLHPYALFLLVSLLVSYLYTFVVYNGSKRTKKKLEEEIIISQMTENGKRKNEMRDKYMSRIS